MQSPYQVGTTEIRVLGPDRFEMNVEFADDAGFAPYRLASLSAKQANPLRQGDRIALLGYSNFREHHRQFHEQLVRLGVGHVDRDGPERAHDWHSGWVAEAVEWLLPQPARNASLSEDPGGLAPPVNQTGQLHPRPTRTRPRRARPAGESDWSATPAPHPPKTPAGSPRR